jgi:penicillin-binding protein 1A
MYRAPQISPEDRPPTRWNDERLLAPAPPKQRSRRRWGWGLLKYALLLTIWLVVLGGFGLVYFAWDLPRPEAALDGRRKPSLTLRDSADHIIASYGDVVGDPLRLADLPPYLAAAAVSVEDRRFYWHFGIDPIGIARALWVNISTGRVAQGGSTITQQVAKNIFLTSARTTKRKVQEVLLTLWLERHFTKTEILEIWLNRIYLGSGAWGIDAAARLYFGVSAREVNLWQAALLAGLTKAPSRYSPRVDPVAAAARAREVLAAMVQTGAISAAQAAQASAQISFPPRGPSAGWYADWIAEQVQPMLPNGADAVVSTSLDAGIQVTVQAKLDALLDGPGAAANVSQGAVIVLDPGSGAVLAMAGGRDHRTSPFNRAVVARRQPGSSFKPFVWLAALEKGARPDDIVLDAPIRLGAWSPSNFDKGFRGEISLEEALAQSVNTVAVRLVLQVGGPRTVIAVARRLGITSNLPLNDTIALGTGEVGLLELVGAYASFFNGGRLVTPYGISSITADRARLAVNQPEQTQVIKPDLAAMMVRMMGAVVTRGSGRAAAVPGHLVAGKSGTTQDFRDAWFVGFLGSPAGPGRIIGVWLGNDDNRPMAGVTGGGLPAKLFHDIAEQMP